MTPRNHAPVSHRPASHHTQHWCAQQMLLACSEKQQQQFVLKSDMLKCFLQFFTTNKWLLSPETCLVFISLDANLPSILAYIYGHWKCRPISDGDYIHHMPDGQHSESNIPPLRKQQEAPIVLSGQPSWILWNRLSHFLGILFLLTLWIFEKSN